MALSSPHESTAAAAASRLAPRVATPDSASWVVADNSDRDAAGRLISAARERFRRLDGVLVSVGGTPPGTVMTTSDDAWRSAFESVFLCAVRLARVLATDLGSRGTRDGAGSATGTGGSIRLYLNYRAEPEGRSRQPPNLSECAQSGESPASAGGSAIQTALASSAFLRDRSLLRTDCLPPSHARTASSLRRLRG